MRTLRWDKKFEKELRACFEHGSLGHQPFFSMIRLGPDMANVLNPDTRVLIACGDDRKSSVIGLARVMSVEKRMLCRLVSGEVGLVLNIGPKSRERLQLVPPSLWERKGMGCHFLTVSIVILESIERRMVAILPKRERKLLGM